MNALRVKKLHLSALSPMRFKFERSTTINSYSPPFLDAFLAASSTCYCFCLIMISLKALHCSPIVIYYYVVETSFAACWLKSYYFFSSSISNISSIALMNRDEERWESLWEPLPSVEQPPLLFFLALLWKRFCITIKYRRIKMATDSKVSTRLLSFSSPNI